MWVQLEPPAELIVVDPTARRASTGANGGVTLEWSPLIVLPEKQGAWIRGVLTAGMAPGAALARVRHTLTRTELGWQVALVEAAIERDGLAVEVLFGAFYAFLEHAGHALARARDAAALEALRAPLTAAFLAARPRLSPGLVHVDGFWDDSDDDDVNPSTDR